MNLQTTMHFFKADKITKASSAVWLATTWDASLSLKKADTIVLLSWFVILKDWLTSKLWGNKRVPPAEKNTPEGVSIL